MGTRRAYAGIAGDERQADRRRRLIEGALDLLADGGPAALTVTAVCKEARLTTRYFYEHFENRDALLEAMVGAEAALIIDVARTATIAATGTPQERGAAGVRALLDALEADPRAIRITRERGHDDLVLRMRAALTARLTAAFIDNAALMWPEAYEHRERLALASSLTMGGVMQLIVEWLEGKSGLSRDALIQIIPEFAIATGAVILAAGTRPPVLRVVHDGTA